ncbi:type II CRISPR RNA-guided endonuclease Cas9 [Pikeienuella sp. HZG-20]|uniref:type II CRISPR RNA-guided endonuclease Cas9 n=1 Tax=Paludibacillus litoralis TaxID=3133267 RepID=UPI0030EE8D7D
MRLGLDIGANSIGWWLYATDGEVITESIDGGSRIFSDGRDPKSGASLAVDRRMARSMRRNRDRYLRRRASLIRQLASAGLMPSDPVEAKALEALDPFRLRTEGLDRALAPQELGRALFHIGQRRGFKSNRKTDRGDNESSKIKNAVGRLDQEMLATGARTYGEFLHRRRDDRPEKPASQPRENADGTRADHRRTKTVRARLTIANRNGEKEEAGYDFYPDRRHLEEEFEKLWDAQAVHHPDLLTDELRGALFETIFHQRPLKTPKVGKCLFTEEDRLPNAHPATQRRILFETVNNLRVTADGRSRRALSREERDKVIHALDNRKQTKTLASMKLTLVALAKELNLPDGQRFTLESTVRDAIACDPVRAVLIASTRMGGRWSKLDLDAQWGIVRRVRAVQSDDEFAALVAWLKDTHGLDDEAARATANAPLPDGFARLGEQATRSILAALEADVIPYSEAVARCGWHHSNERTGECLDRLPYYGEVLDRHVIPGSYNEADDDITRFGRITNPTVHIGLNQLRRLVNMIVDVYGKPDQIVVELSRDLKQSEDQKRETQKNIRKATDEAIRRGRQLEEDFKVPNTGANRMILRLWEDLSDDAMARRCPYSGRQISCTMLFDGSCDVDHILPFSRTLDDGFANRTLCLKEMNRAKGDKSPWEAFGGTVDWPVIEANLKHLPDNKRWRFASDAMTQFEEKRGFLDRALVDTQYLSRISRAYLDTLFTEGGHVWVVPGRLTEMLRRHWGLNSLLPDREGAGKAKNRTDHRHHAVDAAVIAATDRSLVKRIADAAGRDEAAGAEQVAAHTPPPWEGFRADIERRLGSMIVSHRADHGRIDPKAKARGRDSTTGALHLDTAYGIVSDTEVVSRVPLLNLTPKDIERSSRGKNIRDPDLQRALAQATEGKSGKDFEAALREFSGAPGPYQGIRRVRLLESLGDGARVAIEDHSGRPYKAYKGDSNHCYELWRLPDGKVKPHVVTTFAAHRDGPPDRPHPAAKRILRVFKRDMVAIEREGVTLICYVQKLDIANGLFLAPGTEANADARSRDKDDTFRLIQIGAGALIKAKARRVFVDEIGRLRDPGPPQPN